MIRMEVLAGKYARAKDVPLEQISDLIRDPATLLWIDLTDATPDDFTLLAREFGFHPLALEDAEHTHQRPKLDQYDDFLFIVVYAVEPVDLPQLFTQHEIALFVGPNYLVTVHKGDIREIQATTERWKEYTDQLQARHVAVLLYSLLDTIVDGYFPVLDTVADLAENIEDTVFSGDGQALQQVFQLRKRLLALRRILAPTRDMMRMLTRRDIELLGPETAVWFQDVYDHVLRVTDAVDTYRDLLASALEAYLSVVSNNLNQVMRTLTSWSIILMSVALVAGIYGMNFRHMPELALSWGYYGALGGMFLIGAGLFALFKHIRWL